MNVIHNAECNSEHEQNSKFFCYFLLNYPYVIIISQCLINCNAKQLSFSNLWHIYSINYNIYNSVCQNLLLTSESYVVSLL
jgi:hypothetical protein